MHRTDTSTAPVRSVVRELQRSLSNVFAWYGTRVFNLIANVNKQLIAYFGQAQLIAILELTVNW